MNTNPIGVFDSGVGGTSVWKAIINVLPFENTLYLADSKNAPYGEKNKKAILELCIKNTELLLQQGAKLIVVACNTATTNAIDYLRKTYEVPFVGIEPAIKPAALQSKTKVIGVLATKGTLSSALFHSTMQLHASGITIIEQEGTGLVEIIEQGLVDTQTARALLKKYISPMLAAGADGIVLGCTHYPYLIPLLQEVLPKQMHIIDSGAAVARQTKAILLKHELLNASGEQGAHNLFTNTSAILLSRFAGSLSPQSAVKFLDF